MIGVVDAVAVAIKYWRQIGVAIVIIALTIALGLAKQDARHWEKKAGNIQSAFDLTVKNYRTAQAEATRIAKAEKARKETQHAQAAAAADADYSQLRDAYRNAVGRVQQAGTNQGHSTGPDLRGDTGSAIFHEGAANDPRVSISRSDALICADNTAFAQKAYDWAELVSGVR